MTDEVGPVDLNRAITIIRNLRAMDATGGRGFLDGVHRQMADKFLDDVTRLQNLNEPETLIAMWGNPIQGYKAFGPFENLAAAHQFGEDMGAGGEWYMTVYPPTSDSFCRHIEGIVT